MPQVGAVLLMVVLVLVLVAKEEEPKEWKEDEAGKWVEAVSTPSHIRGIFV
jgi:hypothetical protein